MVKNKESIQLLNTAVIKSKESVINSSYEERLSQVCERPAIKAITLAVNQLAEDQKISNDLAAIQIIETIRELDSIWNDYMIMEGLNGLKELLKNSSHPLS